MSITNSLYIGISGLMAHGDAISVVGDNIANASTIGYKRNRASFSDLLGGEISSQRLGGGVTLGGTQTMWDQGAITQTGNPMDLAISGGGMFVVKGNHGGHDAQYYTRDGRFSLDNQGYMVDQHGMRLQGYGMGTDGKIGASIGDMQLGAKTSPAQATATAKMSLTLDSREAAPTIPFDPTKSDSYNYQTSMQVYDSLGNQHKVDVYFRKTANPGEYEIHQMVDGADVGGTPGTPMEIGTGTATFDTNGALTSTTPNPLSATASFTNATANQAITFDFTGSQSLAANEGVASTDVDGHASGKLVDVKIADDGTITGVYDNGDHIDMAKVALADVANDEGLERVGDGMYQTTTASGQAMIDAPGSGKRGSLVSGALEASNVDLGTELVTLIAYQRAFQANAKTVTTADEMMSDVTNLKR